MAAPPSSSSKLFVIGDVHGCAAELRTLLRKLPLDQDSTLIFLGDYVDRGPDAKGVIDTILALRQIYNVIPLKGNHEWLFAQYLARPNDANATSNFVLNGGSNTLASYSDDGTTYSVPVAHLEFLAALPLYYSTDTHFFVHAGIPPDFDFSENISAKTAHQLLWIRSVFLESKVKWPKMVVHGHTPVEKAEFHPNRINLDTGCVFGRQLTAMNMATGELISVPRQPEVPARVLQSNIPGGQPRAQRFEGEIAVELVIQGSYFPFRTVNFNEFGLLVFPAPGSEHLHFDLGDKIFGQLLPGGDSVFEFDGAIVRTDVVNGKPALGIKFERLRNLRDDP